MAKAKKPSTEIQLDMFAPAVPAKPPEAPIVVAPVEPDPIPEPARPATVEPVRAVLPESMQGQDGAVDPVAEVEQVVVDAFPLATCAEAILAAYIARWEPLVFLWDGGTPDVCAPYAGGTADQRGWKARWMDLALAERVLTQYGYALHSFHEGPFPGGGGARKARSWLRPRTTEERAKAPPVALLAVELEVPDVLDDLARVRQQAIS